MGSSGVSNSEWKSLSCTENGNQDYVRSCDNYKLISNHLSITANDRSSSVVSIAVDDIK